MGSVQSIAALAFMAVLLIFVFIIAIAGIRIIDPYEKGVVERLGRFLRVAPSGLTVIIPFIDRITKVDMREQLVDVPPQEVITKDNVVVTVDAIVYYEATDPVKLIYNVVDFYSAATKLAQTNLRNVIGEMELDEALTSREVINAKLREVLDDATDKWGVRVVRVEIKRIDPPTDVMEAMHRQMKAEREKRAQILEAEGHRQSRILMAEGDAEAVKLVANAERFRLEVEATGQSNAINAVFGAIMNANPSQQLIAVQYIDALKAIANGTASKVFVPYEASALLGALGGIREMLSGTPPTQGVTPGSPQAGVGARGILPPVAGAAGGVTPPRSVPTTTATQPRTLPTLPSISPGSAPGSAPSSASGSGSGGATST